MDEDVMVIPLRVPRELGRAWKVEAVKQDKSVQKWILEQMSRTILVHKKVSPVRDAGPVTTKDLDEKPVEGRTVGAAPATGATLKPGYGWCMACKVEPVKLPGVLCPKCQKL